MGHSTRKTLNERTTTIKEKFNHLCLKDII